MLDAAKYSLKGGGKTNWALLALLFIMPLRNIQVQYLPNLGGGLNVLNILFFIAFIHSHMNGKKYEHKLGINSVLVWYILSSIVALVVGYVFLGDNASGNWNSMKDQLIPIILVFVIQRSAVDMVQWRRICIACLLPLPYCFKVVWTQYKSVAQWHYSDDLRVSGTFMDLGANEMAAYSVTLALVSLGCIIACWSEKKYRNAFLMFFMFSGLCVLYSYSRGAYVAFILGAVVIFMRYKNTAKLILPTLVILAICIVNLPPSISERFSSIDAEEGERDASAESRFVFWEIAFNNFLKRPVVGYGYHTVRDPSINPYEMDTHNYYVKVLVERGVLGSIMFIILLKSLWSITKRNLDWRDEDNVVNGVVLGMGGAIVAMMLGNMFGDRFSHYAMITSFWAFIGLISVVELMRLEKKEVKDDL